MIGSSRDIDALMENASQALAAREYLACEALCVQAQALARKKNDWDDYARILLPLQEARRHRRTIATEGFIRLGVTAEEVPTLEKSLPDHPFCLVLTQPGSPALARRLQNACRQEFCYAQVFWADSALQDATWRVRTCGGMDVEILCPAPLPAWRNRWLSPLEQVAADPRSPAMTPGDWVINAGEALGDACLALVKSPPGTLARVAELEACLEAVLDHEILHQQLAQAARALARS